MRHVWMMKNRIHSSPLSRRVAAIIGSIVLLLTGAIAGPAHAEDTLAKIKSSAEMVVGTSAAYAPFEFREAGKLAGFDIDLGHELAKRMGVDVKWVEIDFKGIIAALKAERVDLLVTAMTRTPERAAQIAFSIPYYDAGIGSAKPKDSPISKPEDLKGKTVGVQLGTSGERYVRSLEGIKDIKTYDTILLALKDLENGRVEAVVNPLPSIRYNLKGLKGIETTEVWVKRVVGINTRLEDKTLMAEINKHIADLKEEGFLERLDEKWFQ